MNPNEPKRHADQGEDGCQSTIAAPMDTSRRDLREDLCRLNSAVGILESDVAYYQESRGSVIRQLATAQHAYERAAEQLHAWQLAARSIEGTLGVRDVRCAPESTAFIVRHQHRYHTRLLKVLLNALDRIASPTLWLTPSTARDSLTGTTVAEIAARAAALARQEAPNPYATSIGAPEPGPERAVGDYSDMPERTRPVETPKEVRRYRFDSGFDATEAGPA